MNPYIKSDAFQAVEVRLPGVSGGGQTQTQFNFPDLPYLRPKMAWIQAIEFYTVGSTPYSMVSGTATVTAAIAARTSLTVYGSVPNVKQGNQIIQQIPIVRLNAMQAAAAPEPFSQSIMLLNDLEIDWTKTYLQVVGGAPANTTDLAYCFGVYFNFKPGSQMNEF